MWSKREALTAFGSLDGLGSLREILHGLLEPIGEQERARLKISKAELEKTTLSFTNKHRKMYTAMFNLYSQIEKEKKLVRLYDEKIKIAVAVLKDEEQNYSFGRIKLNDNDIRSKVGYDHGHRDYKPSRLPYSPFLKEVFKDDLIALNYDGWIEGA